MNESSASSSGMTSPAHQWPGCRASRRVRLQQPAARSGWKTTQACGEDYRENQPPAVPSIRPLLQGREVGNPATVRWISYSTRRFNSTKTQPGIPPGRGRATHINSAVTPFRFAARLGRCQRAFRRPASSFGRPSTANANKALLAGIPRAMRPCCDDLRAPHTAAALVEVMPSPRTAATNAGTAPELIQCHWRRCRARDAWWSFVMREGILKVFGLK